MDIPEKDAIKEQKAKQRNNRKAIGFPVFHRTKKQ